MNQVIITGRITKKLELRYTNNNNPVCEFNLAVNRIGSEEADFINCTLFGKQAENLTKYQGKGSLIAVAGALRVDNWKNDKGDNRYKTYVLANNVEYLGANKETTAKTIKDPFAEFGEQMETNDSELPF